MLPINVLSCFDGMGGGLSALKKAGIPIANYYASEIEKRPMQVAKALHPEIQHIGRLEEVIGMLDQLPKIDLIIGGSPCQGFSGAGLRLNFEDPRSKLFFDFVQVRDEIKKRNSNLKWLLENVVPKKQEWQDIISKYMGIEPIRINSALLSAQNRDRLYWTNIGTTVFNLFGLEEPGIQVPMDKGIVLRDILEENVDEKYYLSATAIQRLLKGNWANRWNPIADWKSKSNTLTTEPGKIRRTDNFLFCDSEGKEAKKYAKFAKDGRLKSDQLKSSTLTAGANSGGNHSDMDIIGIFQYGEDGLRQELTSQSWQNNNHLLELFEKGGFRARRLTPREFGRLQTYTEAELDIIMGLKIKDTPLFKMFGNGFTKDVIAYILEHLK